MKQFSLIIVLMLFFHQGNSQRFYIEPGISRTTMVGHERNNNTSVQSQTSAVTRGSFFIKLQQQEKRRLLFEIAAGYEARGAKFIEKNFDARVVDRDIKLNYMTAGITLSYKALSKKPDRFFDFGVGPYFSYLLSGSEQGLVTTPTTESTINNRIEIKTKNPDKTLPTVFTPVDFGGNFFTRYTIHQFRFSIQYSLGLKGMLTNSSLYDRQYSHQALGLSVSYRLAK